ncbi:MAG TPA: hypothetical protein VMU43_12235 [Candidatus Acidoferrum sp.]|nr:hypothetical protein [Candidatus Acidoferrum sp.]
MHIRRPLRLLHLNALVLSGALLLEGLDLLIGDFTVRENGDEIFGQNDILNINALRLDLILLELRLDVRERIFLHLLSGLDEADCGHALQAVAEVIADSGLKNLVHEVLHRPDHADYTGRFRVGHVNLHLQVNLEDEALVALGDDLLKLAVEIVRFRNRVGPIEIEDCRGNNFGFIASRVERIFSGAQRLLPDTAAARMHKRSILKFIARGILRDEANVGFDDGDFSLFHDHHRNKFDADEKWIEGISPVEKRIMLKADLPALVEECLKVLIVVVELILAAQERFDDLLIGGSALFHIPHVRKAAKAAGDIPGGKRITLVGGDDADDVDA